MLQFEDDRASDLLTVLLEIDGRGTVHSASAAYINAHHLGIITISSTLDG